MAFKEAELADHPGVLRVIVYNPEEERDLTKALGITEERSDFLIEHTKECRGKANSIGECLNMMSKRVENANELAFIMLNFGANLAKSGEAKSSKKEPVPKTTAS